MFTSDHFWKMFMTTGSIYYYLRYRQVTQAPASS